MEQTVGELFSRFDSYAQTEKSVVIHPGLKYGFLEVTPEFAAALRKALEIKIMLASNGIEEIDPITKFAVMMLENSY